MGYAWTWRTDGLMADAHGHGGGPVNGLFYPPPSSSCWRAAEPLSFSLLLVQKIFQNKNNTTFICI